MKCCYPHLRSIAIVFLILALSACSMIEYAVDVIGDNMGFNTKRDPQGYNLENKAEYRLYKHYKRMEEKEKERKILEGMYQEKTQPPKK